MSFLKYTLKFLTIPASVLTSFSADGDKKNKVGGQAIIEGVMMRGKEKVAWSLRRMDGSVTTEELPFVSLTKRKSHWGIPIVRGTINLFESFKLGYKALARSADIAVEDEEAAKAKEKNEAVTVKKENSVKEKLFFALNMTFAFAISIGLFMYAPMWTVNRIEFIRESPLLFNLSAGIIRITLFLAYIAAISLWKEMRRVFEYHGAEHMAIFTYEDGKELTLHNMKTYKTVHPRCGTSFLILVAISSILLFTIIDALYIQHIGPFVNVAHRLGVHLVLVPLVSGFSYEMLKLSDKYQRFPVVGLLIKPGLWLQKITTKTPDNTQLEIASTALKAAL